MGHLPQLSREKRPLPGKEFMGELRGLLVHCKTRALHFCVSNLAHLSPNDGVSVLGGCFQVKSEEPMALKLSV